MTLQDIKETKRYGHTFVRSFVRTDGQRENSIPSHKHSLRGYKKEKCSIYDTPGTRGLSVSVMMH